MLSLGSKDRQIYIRNESHSLKKKVNSAFQKFIQEHDQFHELKSPRLKGFLSDISRFNQKILGN